MSDLLQVIGLGKQFGGLRAVDDLSFAVTSGSIAGLIGPNGAGKTTAFNLISGTLLPSTGSVIFDGEDITGRRPSHIARRGLVRTLQSTTVYPTASAYENVLRAAIAAAQLSIGASILGAARVATTLDDCARRAGELLELLNLASVSQRLAGALAYGQQRRLGIAIALAASPRLLLMDEPVAGLNSEEGLEVARLIRRMVDELHLTVLLVEHSMRVVMGVCDRIVVLDHGSKIAEGAPAEIQANSAVIEAYLGAPETEDA
jgi:branched-chain amino acid transport system ATP-binding protein